MDRADILAGSAFKAVLRSALAFVAVLAIGAFLTEQYVESVLMEEARQRVNELHHGLVDVEQTDSESEVVALVNTLARSAAGETLAYALYRGDGTLLAGNVDATLAPEAWEIRPLTIANAGTGPQDYLLHASRIGEGVFVSGLNLSFIEAAELAMIRGFAIAGFVVVIAMIAIGYLLSRRSQEKLEAIEQVLERVAGGDVSARIGVDQPRDQVDRISQKVDAQLVKLDAMMQATRRASAAVAHDLRKPLARVSMILERGLARAEAGDDVRAELEDGLAGLGKLNGIIATILRIARIESHDIGDFKRFDLREILDEIAETFEPVAEDAGQRLVYDRPAAEVGMVGDADMIAQLTINLVQNAITHAGDGAKISLGVAKRQGSVTLTVSDNGPGIPEELRARVFEPMFRADAARTRDGNGLGMALVKAIAERHLADISLSDAKPGLLVSVTFPAS